MCLHAAIVLDQPPGSGLPLDSSHCHCFVQRPHQRPSFPALLASSQNRQPNTSWALLQSSGTSHCGLRQWRYVWLGSQGCMCIAGRLTRAAARAGLSIFCDLALALFPVYFLRTVQMKSSLKAGVCALMGLGIMWVMSRLVHVGNATCKG